MKRYIVIAGLVLAGLLVGQPILAQKKKCNKEDKENKENKASKESKSNKDTKEVDPWKLLYEESKQKVTDLEQSVNDLQKKCASLEQDTTVLLQQHKKDTAMLRQQHQNELNALRQQYEKKLLTLRQQREKDSTDLAQKNERLLLLKDIEEQWIQQFVANVDNQWTNATCSLANAKSKELDKALEVCNKYASNDKRIDKAKQKLEKVKKDVEVYNQIKAFLTKAYDKQVVTQLLPLAEALAESRPNDQEANDLYVQLYSYETIMDMLKEIVAKVDMEFVNGKTAPVFALAKSVLDDEKATIDDILSYHIPWVDKWYTAYADVLAKGARGQKRYKDYLDVRALLVGPEQ